jgi:beta-galactosidase
MITSYTFDYEPGELKAINYRKGNACESAVLSSAQGEKHLQLIIENDDVHLEKNDVIYVRLRVADKNGRIFIRENPLVQIRVDGAGELIGFANDDPCPTQDICDTARNLYDGTALALIRPNAVGAVTITATADGFADVTAKVMITE